MLRQRNEELQRSEPPDSQPPGPRQRPIDDPFGRCSTRANVARAFSQIRNLPTPYAQPEPKILRQDAGVSPTKWHLAPRKGFRDFYLKKFVSGYQPDLPEYAIFNLYDNAAGDMHRRDCAALILRPTVSEAQRSARTIDGM